MEKIQLIIQKSRLVPDDPVWKLRYLQNQIEYHEKKRESKALEKAKMVALEISTDEATSLSSDQQEVSRHSVFVLQISLYQIMCCRPLKRFRALEENTLTTTLTPEKLQDLAEFQKQLEKHYHVHTKETYLMWSHDLVWAYVIMVMPKAGAAAVREFKYESVVVKDTMVYEIFSILSDKVYPYCLIMDRYRSMCFYENMLQHVIDHDRVTQGT